MKDEITLEEAYAMLPPKDTIHVYVGSGNLVIGADWDRLAILELLGSAKGYALAGGMAAAMGHSLVVEDAEGKHKFIEAVAPAVEWKGYPVLDKEAKA